MGKQGNHTFSIDKTPQQTLTCFNTHCVWLDLCSGRHLVDFCRDLLYMSLVMIWIIKVEVFQTGASKLTAEWRRILKWRLIRLVEWKHLWGGNTRPSVINLHHRPWTLCCLLLFAPCEPNQEVKLASWCSHWSVWVVKLWVNYQLKFTSRNTS